MTTHDDDLYTVITPMGMVKIDFPEDGGTVFTGPDDAQQFLIDFMGRHTNSTGAGMTPTGLTPHDLVFFCQPDGSGIMVFEPFSAVVSGQTIMGSTE